MAAISSTATKPKMSRGRLKVEQYLLRFILSLGAILMVAPFYWTFITAFKSREEVLLFPPTWWPRQPTLEHWFLPSMNVGSFPDFYRNSLFVTISVTFLVLLTSALAGYIFAKHQFM